MDTLPKLLNHQAEARGGREALRAKKLGLWRSLTWRDVLDEVRRFACGLLDMGVVRGDTVAVIGNNTPRIFCSITACQAIGAIPVPIYGKLAGGVLGDMLKEIAVSYVVAEDQQQVDDVLEMKPRGVDPGMIIYTVERGMSNYDRSLVRDFEDVQKRGDEYLSAHPGIYEESVNGVGPDDVAMIVFSSGTETVPKPVVMTHRHILSVGRHIAAAENVTDEDETLSFMPIFLPANLVSGHVLSYLTGMCLSCPESTETVMENLREIGPSLLYAPPHVYKHFLADIRERITLTRGLSRKIYDKYMHAAEQGQRSQLGEILVMAPVRELYGLNRLRVAFTSGDAISANVFGFFDRLGIGLKQIYGSAETFGYITLQAEERTEQNVGHAVRGMEIKIADNGEVMCRGENVFSCYYNDEQSAAAVLDQDGWFHTGDVGTLNSNGELVVMDRIAALGKLRDGTDFMPKVVEKEIKGSLYINEAFVSGNGEESLVAVLTIDGSTVSAWAEHHDIRYTGYADLAAKPEVRDLLKEEVAQANQRVAGRQPTVKSFVIFHRNMSPQTGELTWTHKLRRNAVRRNFDALFGALHAGREAHDFNDPHSGAQVSLRITSF